MPKEFSATTETLVLRAAAIALVCGLATLAGTSLQRGPQAPASQGDRAEAPTRPAFEAPLGREAKPAQPQRAVQTVGAPRPRGSLPRSTFPALTTVAADPQRLGLIGVKSSHSPHPETGVFTSEQKTGSISVRAPLAAGAASAPSSRREESLPAPRVIYPQSIRVAQRSAGERPDGHAPRQPQDPQSDAENDPVQEVAPSDSDQSLLGPLVAALRDRSDQLLSSGHASVPREAASRDALRPLTPQLAAAPQLDRIRVASAPRRAPTSAAVGRSSAVRPVAPPRPLFSSPTPSTAAGAEGVDAATAKFWYHAK